MAFHAQDQPILSFTRTRTAQGEFALQSITRTRTTVKQRALALDQGDFPISVASKAVSGTIYGPTGAAVANATVKLVRQMDDKVVATSVSDPAGHYLFPRDADDVFAYYLISYTAATGPQIHGVSDRGSVPA